MIWRYPSKTPAAPLKFGNPPASDCPRESICFLIGRNPSDYSQDDEEEPLSDPMFDNLQAIMEELASVFDILRKRKISNQLLQDNVCLPFLPKSAYLRKLGDLFK